MTQTLYCPGCQAQLLLPSLPDGQSVQCPRCQDVFEPVRQRTAARPVAAMSRRSAVALDDLPLRELPLTRPERLRGEWTGYLVVTLLAISTLSFGVQVYLEFEYGELVQAQLAQEVPRFGKANRAPRRPRELPLLEQRWRRWNDLSAKTSEIHKLIYSASAIVFLIWLCQASGNLRTLQAQGLSHTPEWAIFTFFVPIMNLYRPCVIVQEIWRASHPGAVDTPLAWLETPRSRLIGWWWGCFVGSLVLPVLAAISAPTLLDELLPGTLFYQRIVLLTNLGMAIAGVLLIVIIRKIGQRQQERYERLYEEAA